MSGGLVLCGPGSWRGHRELKAAALCTLGSVSGAFLGYAIGYGFMAAVGQPIVDFYHAQHHWEAPAATTLAAGPVEL